MSNSSKLHLYPIRDLDVPSSTVDPFRKLSLEHMDNTKHKDYIVLKCTAHENNWSYHFNLSSKQSNDPTKVRKSETTGLQCQIQSGCISPLLGPHRHRVAHGCGLWSDRPAQHDPHTQAPSVSQLLTKFCRSCILAGSCPAGWPGDAGACFRTGHRQCQASEQWSPHKSKTQTNTVGTALEIHKLVEKWGYFWTFGPTNLVVEKNMLLFHTQIQNCCCCSCSSLHHWLRSVAHGLIQLWTPSSI